MNITIEMISWTLAMVNTILLKGEKILIMSIISSLLYNEYSFEKWKLGLLFITEYISFTYTLLSFS